MRGEAVAQWLALKLANIVCDDGFVSELPPEDDSTVMSAGRNRLIHDEISAVKVSATLEAVNVRKAGDVAAWGAQFGCCYSTRTSGREIGNLLVNSTPDVCIPLFGADSVFPPCQQAGVSLQFRSTKQGKMPFRCRFGVALKPSDM